MTNMRKMLVALTVLMLSILACTPIVSETPLPTLTQPTPSEPTSTPILEGGYTPGESAANEPVLITGTIPFTSPFFINMASEPFVMLEDQAGFFARDEDYEFPLPGQTIGPVWQIDDSTMEFSLSLPSVPQGTLLDVDNNGSSDSGVMVFQVAFWSNIWGDPFLEEREGTGWSGSYTSALTDPERDYEIFGGTLVIWAPDDQQSFPSGYGADKLLLTADDPVQPVPAGYSLVSLDSEPFQIYKEAHPVLTLVEGPSEVKDYSAMSMMEAFDTMFERVRVEYPFTEDKNVDWDALYAEFSPQIRDAQTSNEYYSVLHDLILRIPDAHVGLGFTDDANRLFNATSSSSFGMRLAELSDGRVIVVQIYPGYAAQGAGIQVGAEIMTWNGEPVGQAIGKVEPFFGPYSTAHVKRYEQLVFLTRYPQGTEVDVTFKNPGGASQTANLSADYEYDSLFDAIPYFNEEALSLPIETRDLGDNLGYIKINTFSDDYNLMAQVWDYHMQQLIDSDIDGLVIDLRVNLGGSGGLAANFAGYFIDQRIETSRHTYYNHDLGEFEYDDEPAYLEPAPLYYDGPIVVLVGPYCVSACEGFAYWLTLNGHTTVVGHTPSAGAFGEVGRGQYTLPGEIDLQVPTGRPETLDGELLIEGTGVVPDVIVPVTEESALGQVDTMLEKAIQILLGN